MLTVLRLQGFLFLGADGLDAENRPLGVTGAPAARRALLPLAGPPASTKTHHTAPL